MRSNRRIAILFLGLAVLASVPSVSAQVTFTSMRVMKSKAEAFEPVLAALTFSWSAADKPQLKALAAKLNAEGSLAFVVAGIQERAREGKATLPELLFLLEAAAYVRIDMDLVRGALALAARDAEIETAAGKYLVQLLHDNYGIAVAYRMPTLADHGILTIPQLKERWPEVQRFLADGEDAKQWINKLVAAGEYEWALKMLDLSLKNGLVDFAYARLMRVGIARLMAAKPAALASSAASSRKLIYSVKESEYLNTDESSLLVKAGQAGHFLAISRGNSLVQQFLLMNGKEIGPVDQVRVWSSAFSSAWAARYAMEESGKRFFIASDGFRKSTASEAGRVLFPAQVAGARFGAIEFYSSDTGGALETGDGVSYPFIDTQAGWSEVNKYSSREESGTGKIGPLWIKIEGKVLGPFEVPEDQRPSIFFSPDRAAWSAYVLTEGGAWKLGSESGETMESLEKPAVAYGNGGYRLVALVAEKGSVKFVDTKGTTISVPGDAADRIYLDPDNGSWVATVKSGNYLNLVDSSGKTLAVLELEEWTEGTVPESDLFKVVRDGQPDGKWYDLRALVALDGTKLAEYTKLYEFALSPDGKKWALLGENVTWDTTLVFFWDGTSRPVSTDARIVFASDGAWWLYSEGKLVSSGGETFGDIAFFRLADVEGARVMYWISIEGNDVYLNSRRL